jgi:hypothetical protein
VKARRARVISPAVCCLARPASLAVSAMDSLTGAMPGGHGLPDAGRDGRVAEGYLQVSVADIAAGRDTAGMVIARVVVLSREDLARAVRDNPFPGETNPRLLHAVFLPGVPGPTLAAWVADAERQVQETGSRDEARVLGRTVYLHTPDGYPRSELRRALAKAGGPTSARVVGTARNWATVSKLLDLCGP